MKAYDCVKWNFLQLVLLQIGLNLNIINWIIGCVTSTNFAVLVNEEYSCLLVSQAKRERKISGLWVTSQVTLTHLLFVDDMLLSGLGSKDEWLVFKNILNIFCSTTGMQISI